ncbi:hypothetical protein ELH26_14400 [Rhizobium leguminosarum]|uniref:hypothetical protein n=1 Tax=Rhizobium leguminosarum TaxID=384 RepID=UPI001030951B|nr:hypothetical protein [Rhizobium leguminosarum]TBC95137.1 hypothetical protein ELH26_14400 [Rhizobium leguminosarum]
MSALLKPFILALDTSHLSDWIRDSQSRKSTDRQRAKVFSEWLKSRGALPLFTLHHLEELCSHDDTDLVRSRIRFLHSLPFIAWIAHQGSPSAPGGVASMMSSEILTAYANPEYDVARVGHAAATSLIQIGTGEDFLGPEPDIWLALREIFLERSRNARALVAVTRTNVIDISSKPMAELLKGRFRSAEGVRRQLEVIGGSLASDILRHGDKRIEQPRTVAADFMRQVAGAIDDLPKSAAAMIWESLATQGVEPSDAKPDSTVGGVLEYGLFLQQMRISTQDSGIPFLDLKRTVSMDRVPSWIISSELRRHGPPLMERKGSELNDTHLACLAAYADLTLVDKRTLEGFRRARRKVSSFNLICRDVDRASSYQNVPALIGAYVEPQCD